jgi:hypothetical protein
MIERRACLCGLAAGAVMPVTDAQPAGQRLPRVVFQGFGAIGPGDEETVSGPLRDGLRELACPRSPDRRPTRRLSLFHRAWRGF